MGLVEVGEVFSLAPQGLFTKQSCGMRSDVEVVGLGFIKVIVPKGDRAASGPEQIFVDFISYVTCEEQRIDV